MGIHHKNFNWWHMIIHQMAFKTINYSSSHCISGEESELQKFKNFIISTQIKLNLVAFRKFSISPTIKIINQNIGKYSVYLPPRSSSEKVLCKGRIESGRVQKDSFANPTCTFYQWTKLKCNPVLSFNHIDFALCMIILTNCLPRLSIPQHNEKLESRAEKHYIIHIPGSITLQ